MASLNSFTTDHVVVSTPPWNTRLHEKFKTAFARFERDVTKPAATGGLGFKPEDIDELYSRKALLTCQLLYDQWSLSPQTVCYEFFHMLTWTWLYQLAGKEFPFRAELQYFMSERTKYISYEYKVFCDNRQRQADNWAVVAASQSNFNPGLGRVRMQDPIRVIEIVGDNRRNSTETESETGSQDGTQKSGKTSSEREAKSAETPLRPIVPREIPTSVAAVKPQVATPPPTGVTDKSTVKESVPPTASRPAEPRPAEPRAVEPRPVPVVATTDPRQDPAKRKESQTPPLGIANKAAPSSVAAPAAEQRVVVRAAQALPHRGKPKDPLEAENAKLREELHRLQQAQRVASYAGKASTGVPPEAQGPRIKDAMSIPGNRYLAPGMTAQATERDEREKAHRQRQKKAQVERAVSEYKALAAGKKDRPIYKMGPGERQRLWNQVLPAKFEHIAFEILIGDTNDWYTFCYGTRGFRLHQLFKACPEGVRVWFRDSDRGPLTVMVLGLSQPIKNHVKDIDLIGKATVLADAWMRFKHWVDEACPVDIEKVTTNAAKSGSWQERLDIARINLEDEFDDEVDAFTPSLDEVLERLQKSPPTADKYSQALGAWYLEHHHETWALTHDDLLQLTWDRWRNAVPEAVVNEHHAAFLTLENDLVKRADEHAKHAPSATPAK
ncbi:hypothetical protein QBC42DRAFT_320847 [Cladorrhinum samala]|uniref:Uncharacterized protein n=1 Tax=Cladorrhinum samala TaxID=585594 RepID=A0AAV9H9G6_9PEZI|nr:hypothetical protein QBC42DRAFT_320847 [Cladorrhinum samala]